MVHLKRLFVGLITALVVGASFSVPVLAATESGSVGIQGTVPSPPPSTGAHISVPSNGQSFSTNPVRVAGTCPGNLLVKLFKNNIFGGSVQCKNGSFSLLIDLFSGQNDLVARVYDDLDQAGPDSNTVHVTFNDSRPVTGARISLSSVYAKRGANPKQQLVWPIILSGGTGPYAISVDWGDNSKPDLISLQFAGTFNIKHIYDNPGVYNIIIRGTDKTGDVAFLQLVGVANGNLGQGNGGQSNNESVIIRTVVIWWPALMAIPFSIIGFFLGARYSITSLRKRIEKQSKRKQK